MEMDQKKENKEKEFQYNRKKGRTGLELDTV